MQFMLLGGFLGSGKTTALIRLATLLAERGQRVGIISNDQAAELVDTATFRSAGFSTAEVPGGCFCCRFDELVGAAARLIEETQPDVILAEPVGSCTDLAATVIRPLRRLYGNEFRVAPYITLLDPDRIQNSRETPNPQAWSDKVLYIFKQQQHEADLIAINKVDTLSPARRRELSNLVHQQYPHAEVLEISARTGEGFERLLNRLEQGTAAGTQEIDVDYDIYADGEAELGWLNAQVELMSPREFSAPVFLQRILCAFDEQLQRRQLDPAHVKATLTMRDSLCVGNLIGRLRPPELANSRELQGSTAQLTMNARVPCDPAQLDSLFQAALAIAAAEFGISAQVTTNHHFSPSRPCPTHRLTSGMLPVSEN